MKNRSLSLVSFLAVVGATACSYSGETTNGAAGATQPPALPAGCVPLETRVANAPEQTPAFAGQTRTCGVDSKVAFTVTVVASGLQQPWAVEPLPGGDLLVTEKGGSLRIVSAAGVVGAPIAGLPAVDGRGQGGLLDVALSPTFATDRTIFWSFTEPRTGGGNGTSVARGILSEDRRSLSAVRVILQAMPSYTNSMHFGSRLAFGSDGKLFVTTGERSDRQTRPQAQQMDSHLGKVLRINTDGTVPSDNPFAGQSNAKPEIWSLGHRNIQAATVDTQGRLWIIEHGAKGGDELNLIVKGRNYGWPTQAYGEEYSGSPIAGSTTSGQGYEQPVYYWDPVIAPSGAEYYTGNAFPQWRNSVFGGALKEKRLVRLVIGENGRVTGEEHLLTDRGQRIRDVRQGPDGALYIVTDAENGELWRVAPSK